eukprot:Rmarinus@m.7798
MGRKGVSADEKRVRALAFFHETKTCYTLKELEKQLPKQKGIVMQSVKEVIQSLIDDGLVDTDKCGSQTLYWSFPSKNVAKVEASKSQLSERKADFEAKLEILIERKRKAECGKENTEERTTKLKRMNELQTENEVMASEIEKRSEFDPEKLAELQQLRETCVLAANRWTDNLFELVAYLAKKTGTHSRDEITKALSYVFCIKYFMLDIFVFVFCFFVGVNRMQDTLLVLYDTLARMMSLNLPFMIL